ncbi:MAG: glycosyltransferase family 2 protein [Bacteroidetes bacterium]|nr:glycosyltransferase family 2 protein [Bacteroidota bacterium]
MKLLSVIIPVFNEYENITAVQDELYKYCGDNFEIIFVNDGSTDNTLLVIMDLAQKDSRIKCISLSRNFGHQNALMAGLNEAKGDVIVTMDGDLQHPPSLIPALLQEINNGNDIVFTKRQSTADIGIVKKMMSSIFYRFINFISDTRIEPNVSDFKAFNRKVLESILLFKERELFLRGIFSWVGYTSTTVDFTAPARKYGRTKYSFGKMLKLALKGTISFSFKPLRLALFIGCCISLAAFGFGIFALVSYYRGNTIPGWASLIIAVMLLGGTQLLAIGLLGEYIAGLFTESKQRPLYLINKKINLE